MADPNGSLVRSLPDQVQLGRNKLHFQPVLKEDRDAYLECLGQGRVFLGGEGEAASVASALPRREPFQIALRDSSKREGTSGVRSQYMAGARRGPRRATDVRAVTARVEVMTSMCPREAVVPFAHPQIRSARRARADQSDTTKVSYSVAYAQLSFDTHARAICGDIVPKARATHGPTASFPT